MKERIHQLVDELPDAELVAAERYLEFLRARESNLPPVLRNAPIDDEPETDEERAAVREAYAAIERGEVYTDEEVRRELGL